MNQRQKNNDFLDLLLNINVLSSYFSVLKNKISHTYIFRTNSTETVNFTNRAISFYDVSGYLEPKLNSKNPAIKIKAVDSYNGTLIKLCNYKNVDDYLKRNFSPNRRSKFKTYKNRLENSFTISYKVYYGDIERKEYDDLFERFYKLIKKRFLQKGTDHTDLDDWDKYYQIGFPLINNKQACLFIIYDDEKPISISLNPIFGTIIYAYIRTFDTDYSKFYLGFTDLIQQLEWCFNNKIEIFDLLKGKYEYKTKWADETYCFQKYMIYDSSSTMATVKAYYRTLKTKTFYTIVRLLKILKVHLLVYKYKSYRNAIKIKRHLKNVRQVTSVQFLHSFSKDSTTEINFNSAVFSFLKPALYTFLYSQLEQLKDIKIYMSHKEPDTFFIQGKNKVEKITYTPQIND